MWCALTDRSLYIYTYMGGGDVGGLERMEDGVRVCVCVCVCVSEEGRETTIMNSSDYLCISHTYTCIHVYTSHPIPLLWTTVPNQFLAHSPKRGSDPTPTLSPPL